MSSPAPTTALPKGLAANPRLATWVRITPAATITIAVGKVELGQGIRTALAQIAADELGVDLGQIRMLPPNTADSPNEGVTAGSMSIADSGTALRQVCAQVRALFVAAAIAEVGLDPATITVHSGVFSDRRARASTTYWELADRVDLDRPADPLAGHGPETVPRAGAEVERVVGTDVPRLDLPDKVAGRPAFIHDRVLPGQLAGRVVRPPSPAATLIEVDTAAVRALPGVVRVVRDGDFLGVVAEDEPAAGRAAAALRAAARWHEVESLPVEHDLAAYLRTGPLDSFVVDQTEPALGSPGQIRASYSRPFLAHASLAPSCGIARWDGEAVEVYSHSQGIFALRSAIATVLGLPEQQVRVEHAEGAGCYGHNGADDAAFDAVLLARAVPGHAVRLQWSRADELAWSPFGSAMVVDLAADLDPAGTVASWSADIFSQGHLARPGFEGRPGLLAAGHLGNRIEPAAPADPPLAGGAGLARNAVPIYEFPVRRVHGHRLLRTSLRTSSLRSLGAFLNVFAIESFMDELALAAGRDPLEFRLAHVRDPRAVEVITTAARRAGWPGRVGPDGAGQGIVGQGIGLARYKGTGAYCAVVAEVEAVHDVRVRRLSIAVDVGRVINPDGVRNQIEGGAIQATSWTLKERVRFDRTRITSVDWESYPILRFSEVPRVEVDVVSRPDQPSVGAGEAAQGPTAAAIGNAVTRALGLRIRDLPISRDRIIAAMNG
ncbi:MAG TPA: molybdopterin cofactor-binding domain-containing protein [Micromonosporaceae bacterium]|jgi:CO/xanthine dehydrogenase Mo-binding subunit